MAESRGLVKLFGQTIPVPAGGDVAVAPVEEAGGGGAEGSKNLPGHSTAADAQRKDQESSSSLEQSEQQLPSTAGSPTADQKATTPEKSSKPAEEPNNASNAQERTIKKPDKILPCPRCNSMDTKFCYYNNYNVSQPRHFCKHCQRYWTAGGTMRNVPVGAGRRKSKHSAGHYRHIAVAKVALQTDITELVHHHAELKPNRRVLSFASDTPLCESMTCVLNLTEKTSQGFNRNGFHHPGEHVVPVSCASSGGVESAEEHSRGSSVAASTSAGDGANIHEPAVQNQPQVPCFSGAPWPYPWPVAPALCASTFPIPFYPVPPYWGCTVPGAWSVPWLAPLPSSPSNGGSAGSGPNSPTLGKHSRDGDALRPSQSGSGKGDASEQTSGERCLWIPKTLRIDDPQEAAKSSIWTTMGFKNDKADGISRGGLFRDFNQTKAEISKRTAETSFHLLHANPAALSRSLNFRESS